MKLRLEEELHLLLVLTSVHRLFLGDDSLGVKIAEGFIHCDHTDILTSLHDAREHEGLTITNGGRDCGGVHEEFERKRATSAVRSRDELLGNDSAERFGNHDPDLSPLLNRENVENAVEGPRGVTSVEGGKNEVTGLSCGEGELDGLEVTHFTDHYDVGIFPESSAERAGEGLGVSSDLALVHVASLGLEDILDGIFQSENVIFTIFVDEINKRRHGGGLTRTHRACDEDKTVLITGERLDVLDGETEVLHRPDVGRNDSEDNLVTETLFHDGGSEATVGISVGEIDVPDFLKSRPIFIIEE